MFNLDLSQLRQKWFAEEKERLEVEKKRRYLHLDDRITTLDVATAAYIWDPRKVAKHPFYPFIRDAQRARRYKKTEGGRVIKVKERPISYASHLDALIYSWYTAILDAAYENRIAKEKIGSNVIAYRKLGKSTPQFAREVFDFIKQSEECAAICFDIEDFFGSLDHNKLKSAWRSVLGVMELPEDHYSVFKSLTRFDVIEKKAALTHFNINHKQAGKVRRIATGETFRRIVRKHNLIETNLNKKGIPQGAPPSAILSNIYMLHFDRVVADLLKGGLYRRYSDDMIIVCKISQAEQIQEEIMKEIANMDLTINRTKTEIRLFKLKDERLASYNPLTSKPLALQYLGIEFDGHDTFLRHRSIASFERRMTHFIYKKIQRSKRTGKLNKKSIYERFSPAANQNFNSYVRTASTALDSSGIRKQMNPRRVMKKIKRKIEEAKK